MARRWLPENAEGGNAVAVEAPPASLRSRSELDLVEEAVPGRAGLVRKAHRLWAGHFRVNFHDPSRENGIVGSVFVSIEGGEAVAL